MADEPISDSEKANICKNFILHAPPGEFNEVFNDVRILLDNDKLMKAEVAGCIAQYNRDQFLPVVLKDSEEKCLITDYNQLPDGKFFDPRTKQTFVYDHLRRELVKSEQASSYDTKVEPWRVAVENAVREYVLDHYQHGVFSVFGKSADNTYTLIACIEDHQFQPHNFWNGRWRSQWVLTVDTSSKKAEAKGNFKVHVHYYEDGNVQLISYKDTKDSISAATPEDTAKLFAALVEESEAEYQRAVSADYSSMSQTTFKALRRALPITRTKIDWNKILGYKIGQALKNQ